MRFTTLFLAARAFCLPRPDPYEDDLSDIFGDESGTPKNDEFQIASSPEMNAVIIDLLAQAESIRDDKGKKREMWADRGENVVRENRRNAPAIPGKKFNPL